MVIQLAFNLMGDYDDALDVSQEVFLRVFRTIGGFRAQSSLRTWIFRIVVNQARNRQRWWRRRRRDAQVPIEDHIRAYGEFRSTSASDPARAYAQKELATRLCACARATPVRAAHRRRPARGRRAQLRRDCRSGRPQCRHGQVTPGAGT